MIHDEGDRAFAHRLIDRAKRGYRIALLPPQRSDDQNAKLMSMLEAVSRQKIHAGRCYDTAQWKILFMHACGQEVEFAPSLDGSTFIPFGGSTKRMSVAEMGELISFIDAWGAQNGVTFKETQGDG